MHLRARVPALFVLIFLTLIIAAFTFIQVQGARYQPDIQNRSGRFAQGPTFGPVIGGASATPGTPAQPEATQTQAQVQPGITQAAPTQPPTQPASVSTPTPLPTLNAEMMGIQIYGNLQEDLWAGVVDRAQFMGFKWIKVQLSWKELEPDGKGIFSEQFTALKKNIIYAGRRFFKIMVSVAKAPAWSRPADSRTQDGPPANPQDLADFITRVYDQFGVDSVYINAVEIWNEANTNAEWTGASLDGGTYMRYFTPAYQAIRARAPNTPIVTAGPAPGVDNNGITDDRKWLQQLYDTKQLPITDPNLFIGVHPYGWANSPDGRCCANPTKGWDNHPTFFFLNTLEDYYAIMSKNGHGQGKLWATEFGWATFQGLHYKDHLKGPPAIPPPDPGLAWMNILTQEQQAHYTIRAYHLAQSTNLANFMGPMFLWNLNFGTLPGFINEDKPSLPEAGFSVLDNDWNTRPIYNMIQSAPKK
jgi:hypothetical protein